MTQFSVEIAFIRIDDGTAYSPYTPTKPKTLSELAGYVAKTIEYHKSMLRYDKCAILRWSRVSLLVNINGWSLPIHIERDQDTGEVKVIG